MTELFPSVDQYMAFALCVAIAALWNPEIWRRSACDMSERKFHRDRNIRDTTHTDRPLPNHNPTVVFDPAKIRSLSMDSPFQCPCRPENQVVNQPGGRWYSSSNVCKRDSKIPGLPKYPRSRWGSCRSTTSKRSTLCRSIRVTASYTSSSGWAIIGGDDPASSRVITPALCVSIVRSRLPRVTMPTIAFVSSISGIA